MTLWRTPTVTTRSEDKKNLQTGPMLNSTTLLPLAYYYWKVALKSASGSVISHCSLGSDSAHSDAMDGVATVQDQKEPPVQRNMAPVHDDDVEYHMKTDNCQLIVEFHVPH
jgi:hypothetical protein